MKTIFVNRFYHPDQSATAQILTDVTRALVRHGPRGVTVITSSADYGADRGEDADEDQAIRVHRVPAIRGAQSGLVRRSINYALFFFGAALLLARHARRGDVVVFKTDPPLLAALLSPLARIRRARTVNWLQDIFPETAERLGMVSGMGALTRTLKAWRNQSLRRADANVVIGSRMGQFTRRAGAGPGSIRTIANWVDDETIAPIPAEANALRSEWGFSGDDLVIGYSGNLGRAHDVYTVLDAMRAPLNEQVRFLFIGGGAGLAPVREAATTLPEQRVAFRPYQPKARLAESLSVPDVHWLTLKPSLEGLIVPSKFYGIAAVGRPILFIGDKDGELAAIIREADCGFTIRPGDTAGLCAVTERLRQHPGERTRMGANARAWLDAHATRDGQLRKWTELIDELHGARSATR